MSADTLTDKLAALPGATASATDHTAVGYDVSVALPESSLLAPVCGPRRAARLGGKTAAGRRRGVR